ncbi:MAG TPA: ABC transporter permease [Baekduia sp.]|nr:ABC transporter permease [Baekduia sp.]
MGVSASAATGQKQNPVSRGVGHVTSLAWASVMRRVVRHLLTAIPLLFLVSVLTFLLVALRPGDAAVEILGPRATHEQVQALRQSLGLDQPWYAQYWHWLEHAVQGDLGNSLLNGQPVTEVLGPRVPVSLSLIVAAVVVSGVVGVSFGVFSAVRGGFLGRVVDTVAVVGFAMPPFWVGGLLIAIFAVKLHWFPAIGYVPFTDSPWGWLKSVTLPVAALSCVGIANVLSQTREAMLDVMSTEYIRMARASGLPSRTIVFQHAMKNVASRILTILGLLAVQLMAGTVLVEAVFALPGLGGIAVSSATQGDLPVIQGVVVLFTLLVIAVNLLIDLAYGALIPQARRK